VFFAAAIAQTKNFTPVEGANLKAKIDNAVTRGRAQGRFWVGYQFEVRPGVGVDFEIVGPTGTFSFTNDGWSMMDDSRYETRELGLFFFYEGERDRFTRAEVYNLRREHQFSGYPVYWAGNATNEESLNYLKSIVDSGVPEINRLTESRGLCHRAARRCSRRVDSHRNDPQAGGRVRSQPGDLLAGIHARKSGQKQFSCRNRSQPARIERCPRTGDVGAGHE
jgi:hypothetical protein